MGTHAMARLTGHCLSFFYWSFVKTRNLGSLCFFRHRWRIMLLKELAAKLFILLLKSIDTQCHVFHNARTHTNVHG